MKYSHTSPTYILIILCLAITLTEASPLRNSLFSLTERPLLNLYATQSGIVPLIRDELGFYAAVDLASFSSDASDDVPSPDTVNAMLSLYSPSTSLITNCLNFSGYTCYQPRCNAFNGSHTTVDYLYFTAQGYTASALLYLDYHNWALDDFATIITSCNTNVSSLYTNNTREAIVGLGVSMDSQPNYLNGPSFSVFIDKNLWSGDLIFYVDGSRVQANTNASSVRCNGNWTISTTNVSYIELNKNKLPLNSSITFDITMDTMGLPLDLYNDILGLFNDMDNVDCSDSLILPTCNYNGSIKHLPNITFYIAKRQNFTILPEIYVQNATNQTGNVSSITLNFRAVSPNLTDDNYVTPTFDNYIILDMNFLSYYYTEFSTSGNWSQNHKITFYISGIGAPTSGSSNAILYVIIGIVVLIILIGVGVCVYYYYYKPRKMKKIKEQKALLSTKEDIVQEGGNQEGNQEGNLNGTQLKKSINVY